MNQKKKLLVLLIQKKKSYIACVWVCCMLDNCFPSYWSFADVVIYFRSYHSFFRVHSTGQLGYYWRISNGHLGPQCRHHPIVVILCLVELPKPLSLPVKLFLFFCIRFSPSRSFPLFHSSYRYRYRCISGAPCEWVKYEIIFCTGATIIHSVQGNWKKKSTRKSWKWWVFGLFITRMEQRAERDAVARVTKVWARRFATE